MTRNDMIDIVKKLSRGEGGEKKAIRLVDSLRLHLPHSKISDLMFHDFRGLTPEQIVDEAIQREAEYIRKLQAEAG